MQPYAVGASLRTQDVADLLDHALLKPELTPRDVAAEVADMARLRVWSVCVRPMDVALARDTVAGVAGSPTRVCTVIGFPHGTTSTTAKVAEARRALEDGATELDMVLPIGALRGGELDAVREDSAAVVAVGHEQERLVKVILETALLTDAQKVEACRVATEAGADFVKTSTGFAGGGATIHDVRLMRANVPETMQVKASGGVRDIDTLLAMLAEGVTRIGTSSSAALVAQAAEREQAGTLTVPERPADADGTADTAY